MWCESIQAYVADCKATKAKYGYSMDHALSFVTPYLIASGFPSSGLFDQEPRITHLINCTPHPELPAVQERFKEGETLLTLNLQDDGDDHKLPEALRAAVEFVQKARQGDSDALVLVHCRSGVNRASVVCLAVLMVQEEMSLLEAFGVLRHARPCVRPKYMREVARFEDAHRGSCSTPALRDGPDSVGYCALYYGLKDDFSIRR